MKSNFLLVLLFSLLCSPLFAADWVALKAGAMPGTPPTFKVLKADVNGTTLELTIPGFWVYKDGRLRLPGGLVSTEEGRPELPFWGCTLALPALAQPTFSIVSADFVLPRQVTVRMAPKPELEGQTNTPPQPLAPYTKFPSSPVQLAHLGEWREVPLCSLQLHPFRSAGNGVLAGVAPRMVIAVNHMQAPAVWPVMAVPREFRPILRAVCANHQAVVAGECPLDGPATEYLVLGPAALKTGVQPLLDWRAEQGYQTEYVSLTSTNPATIKSLIQTRYNGGKLLHVVLLGDYAQIPYYNWGTSSEVWYACLTGGSSPDLFPDVGLGRLCGTTVATIQHQVQKILRYEINPPAGNWYTKTILAAHKEQAPGKYVGCSENIAVGPLATSGWKIFKQYGHLAGSSNAQISAYINQGVGIVNYRGHGGVTDWISSWSIAGGPYDISKVNALTNGKKTPIVFNIACLNGDFKSSCLQEAWMQANAAAVASLGAIEPSMTIANHTYDETLYKSIFGDKLNQIYAFWYKATSAIIAMGSSGQSNAKMYWWGGDCATRIWTKVPQTLVVTHPATLKSAATSIPVSVKTGATPLEGATVCLYMDQVIHACLTTDKLGLATFPIAGLNAGTMKVTVQAKDYLPYRGKISITGQSYLGPTIPTGLAAAEGTSSTEVPAKYAPCTSQSIYDAALLTVVNTGLIRTLFLRRDGLSTATFQAHKFTCDVSIATLGVPGRYKWSATSYKANQGSNFTKVLSAYSVDFGADPKPANPPAPYSVMFPLTTPIQYNKGENLLIQFDVAGNGTNNWVADAQPYFHYNPGVKYSQGCPSGKALSGRSPYPDGQGKLTWTWDSGGGYNQPALGILGTNNKAFGFFIIPLPLSWLGAPGCYLNTNLVLGFPGKTDATGVNGRYRVEMLLPNQPDLAGATVYTQTLVLKTGFNNLGLMASEGLRMTLGNLEPAMQLSTHGVSAPFGDKPRFVDYKGLVIKLGM